MKKIFLTLILFISFIQADITKHFPELSGRVVDEANLLGSLSEDKLNDILQKHEEETSNQIVVVILRSLNGNEIADYSYQLGRHWGIGQKDKDNGVLLVIATEDRKLRIEVGYGLEGALTDKISHEIIEYTLKPKFRAEQYEKGILQAVDKIILAIKGEYKNDNTNKSSNIELTNLPILFFLSIFFAGILSSVAKSMNSQKVAKFSIAMLPSGFAGFFAFVFTENYLISLIAYGLLFAVIFFTAKKIDFSEKSSYRNSSSSSYGGFSSGGSFGSSSGGFSGGGGSFGGGGASGGW